MSVAGGPYIIRDGDLVFWLDMADNKSFTSTGSRWLDLTNKSGYYASFPTGVDAPVYNPQNFSYISLTGGNSYIKTNFIPPSISGAAITYETVFRNNYTGNYAGFIGASEWKRSGHSLAFFGKSQIGITYEAYSTNSYEPKFNYNNGVFTHGTFVFSGRSFTAYRNAIQVYTDTSMTFDAQDTFNSLAIGRNQQAGYTNSTVDIALVRVYDRALSQQEITQNFNATRSRFSL